MLLGGRNHTPTLSASALRRRPVPTPFDCIIFARIFAVSFAGFHRHIGVSRLPWSAFFSVANLDPPQTSTRRTHLPANAVLHAAVQAPQIDVRSSTSFHCFRVDVEWPNDVRGYPTSRYLRRLHDGANNHLRSAFDGVGRPPNASALHRTLTSTTLDLAILTRHFAGSIVGLPRND